MPLQYSDDEFELEDDGPSPPVKQPEIYHKRNTTANQANTNEFTKQRNLRIRPMSPAMRDKHPDVLSITLTRTDGRQLIFVRK